jgi:hypothetical protein
METVGNCPRHTSAEFVGIFTSLPDLKRKLMRYIRQYHKNPKTVKRKYFDPSRRITPESFVTAH